MSSKPVDYAGRIINISQCHQKNSKKYTFYEIPNLFTCSEDDGFFSHFFVINIGNRVFMSFLSSGFLKTNIL